MYMEAECPKFSCGYICKKEVNLQLQTATDCIHRLIMKQDLLESCQLATVSLSKPAMEKLDDQHFVVSFPQPSRVQLSCGREDYNLLEGSYLATIPHNCYIQTPEFTIVNEDDEVRGHPLKLTEIPEDVINQAEISSHVNLKSVDLRQLHNIQNKLLLETPLRLDTNLPSSLFHTTLPMYVTLIGISIFAVIFVGRRYRLCGCKPHNAPKPESNCTQIKREIENADSSHTQDGLPAIFSLNIGK